MPTQILKPEVCMDNELFAICSDRNPDPAEQCRRISTLLKAGADIHATDKNGVTALHHAVRFRSPAAVKTLIEHGAIVNQACRKRLDAVAPCSDADGRSWNR